MDENKKLSTNVESSTCYTFLLEVKKAHSFE